MKLTTALQMLWSMSSGYRKFLLAHVLTGMIRILLSLAFIAVSKQIVDVATLHTDGRLSTGISLLIGCMLLQLVLSGLTNRLHVTVSINLSNHLRNRLFSHVLYSRWHGREKLHSGDVLNRMQKDVDVVVGLLCGSFPAFFITLFQLAGASFYLLLLDEPTSSLDAATEQLLLQRLSHSLKGKTLLVITHQESTACLCQSVIRIPK